MIWLYLIIAFTFGFIIEWVRYKNNAKKIKL